ncbi:MAG: helix-turn-helix domain-containing protein, partial [Chloroflexota bacterium]|nr:helix-turn-helix domain-containing protein [Chloroflexota bacterium]
MPINGTTEFGQLLRRFREDRGLTQEELSYRTGDPPLITREAISKLECGKTRRPRLETVRLLADMLELNDIELEAFERAARPERQSRSPRSISGSLPPVPKYFKGREAEMEELSGYIRDPVVRLVRIVGRNGMGKTSLVCHLLGDPEGRPLPEGIKPPSVYAVLYLGEAGRQSITFANLYFGLSKLLPRPIANKLNAGYEQAERSTKAKMRELLAALPERRKVVVLLDELEDVMDLSRREIREPELDPALRALLEAPPHPVTVVLTTHCRPRSLGRVQHILQRDIELREGLDGPSSEYILRALDRSGTRGLRDAPSKQLQEAGERVHGNPRALEMLVSILETDRESTLDGILGDVEGVLPHEILDVLVGKVFAKLDSVSQGVMQALAIYGRYVTVEAVEYLLRPWWPDLNISSIINQLVNLLLVQREVEC